MTYKGNSNNTTVICIITIMTTVLTQVPSISMIFRPVMYVMWVLLLFVGLTRNHFNIATNRFLYLYIATLVILIVECLVCNAIMGTHADSYALQVIPLPLLCYLVGLLIAKSMNEADAKKCVVAFFITSFFMFSYIFATYIGSFSVWYNASYYIYEQKNSAAQIIGCTILLTGFLIKTNNKWLNAAKYLILAFMFLIIIAMQCRTALVGLIITAMVYYFSVLRGRKKIFVTVALIALLVVAMNTDLLLPYITKAFVFTDRQMMNLDYFTSGRLTYFSMAWDSFCDNPIVGTGHYRVDDFYLCVLSDVGLIGALPIIVLWIYRMVINYSAFRRSRDSFSSCLMCMTVFYFAESLFEAYPPFGPGVCAFMFWIVCAFLDVRRNSSWGIKKI